MNVKQTIIRPVITEKSTRLAQNKVYSFLVDTDASKHQIMSSIKALYGVDVKHARTTIRKGKVKKVGRRMVPKQMAAVKIAQITLVKGAIESFPQS